MVSFCLPLLILTFILVTVWRARQGKQHRPQRLSMAEIGTIMDRSIWCYRQYLVPFLLFSIVLLPFGNFSGTYFTLFLGFLFPTSDSSSSFSMFSLLLLLATISVPGVGKTLLMLAVAATLASDDPDTSPTRRVWLFVKQRFWAIAGFTALMCGLWLFANIVGFFAFGFIGWLISFSWLAAPAVLVFESLGPLQALKRSFQIGQHFFSGLLNTIVPLWCIGWIAQGVPLYGGLLIAQLVYPLSPAATAHWMMTGFLLGNIIVSPLLAVGAVQFYRYIQERPETMPPNMVQWEGHTLLFRHRRAARYLWLASRTHVLVDETEVATTGGFGFKKQVTGTFVHQGQPCTFLLRLAARLRVMHLVTTYELDINAQPVDTGTLSLENGAMVILPLTVLTAGLTLVLAVFLL